MAIRLVLKLPFDPVANAMEGLRLVLVVNEIVIPVLEADAFLCG